MFEGLPTPHAVVDMERVRENLTRVHCYAKDHRLRVRPHVKTHKDQELARLQIAYGASGLTCATAREAEVMVGASSDLLLAYPPVDPARIKRVLSLPKEAALTIALDSEEALDRLTAAAKLAKRFVRILIELDLGGRRTGVSQVADLLDLAYRADTKWTAFGGILFHPGNLRQPIQNPLQRGQGSFDSVAPLSIDDDETTQLSPKVEKTVESAPVEATLGRIFLQQADLRRDLLVHLDALKQAHFDVPVVSGGNTPTLFYSHHIPELTEIRPGTYVYSDRDIAWQGVMPWDACAYTVLATVVSTAVPGQAVIDAGTKALAKEPLAEVPGYGALLDRPEVIVKGLSEEHGILDLRDTDWVPKIGERVRVVPNHVCVSVHLQDEVAYLDGDRLTVRPVAARGR